MTKDFEIHATTATLSGNKNREIFSILDRKWEVPIYQRPYSWTEKEIERLVSDMFIGYWGNDDHKEIKEETIFFGTMQFGAAIEETGRVPIIDGQQRITTLLLLLNILRDKDVSVVKNIDLDLLETRVFSGEQQENLKSALKAEPSKAVDENSLNKYLVNQNIIFNELMNQVERNEDSDSFDWERFSNYLLNNLYFVIIETKANLSKTLKIFETINATGMDLDGSDIFKVRFYEYLRRFHNKEESVFNDISNLYALIDKRNKEEEKEVTDMNGILDIYRYILIAKHESLPRSLYTVSVDVFYEGLFDLLLNNSKTEKFTNNKIKEEVKLSIKDIERIIAIRYLWHKRTPKSQAAHLSYKFIRWSRYPRYWRLIIVFLFQYLKEIEDSEDPAWHQSEIFTEQLNKLLFAYSIRFLRAVNGCHKHVRHILEQMFIFSDPDHISTLIGQQLRRIDSYKEEKHGVHHILNQPITHNYRHKNLLCRLSAMIDELKKNSKIAPHDLTDKLFPVDNKIDIEHIQSYHDEDVEKRVDISKEWGDEINSLGNLVILDAFTNKSLGNSSFAIKKEVYKKSEFASVQKVSKFQKFNKDTAQKRKAKEIGKITNYLFVYDR